MRATRIALINMGLFVIWAKIYQFVSEKWTKESEYLRLKAFDNSQSASLFDIANKDLFEISNSTLNSILKVRDSTFFSIFKVNLNSECNFFTQQMICNFASCSVCQCSDSEIPLPWKHDSMQDIVNKDIGNKQFFKGLVDKYNYSSREWLVENEIDNRDGIYVNLLKNPETWTGYIGTKIWNSIYLENCMAGNLNICVEEKMFYNLISGMHTNINLHLSTRYLNVTDLSNRNQLNSIEESNYYKNFTLAYDRVLLHPDRMANLYHLFSFILLSLDRAEVLLKAYKYETGNITDDAALTQNIHAFYDELHKNKEYARITNTLKQSPDLNKFLSFQRVDEFKMKFRNISSIIDCVACQKCKLHGKLQVYGMASMLKILFEKNNENMNLKRNELIAYFNFSIKVFRSVNYLFEIINEHKRQTSQFKMLQLGFLISFIISAVIINYYSIKYKPKTDNRIKLLQKYQNRMLQKYNKVNECFVTSTQDPSVAPSVELTSKLKRD